MSPTPRLMKAVLPAAGRGTRIRDERGDRPKECVEIAGLPMIAHALLEMALAGLEQVCVVISPEKHELAALLDDLPRFPEPMLVQRLYPGARSPGARHAWPEIVTAVQQKPLGVVDALSSARAYLAGSDFALVMPDNLLVGAHPVTGVLAEAYARSPGSLIAFRPIDRREAERTGNCGHIEVDGPGPVHTVRALHPKRAGVFAFPAGAARIHRAVGRSIVPASIAEPRDPRWDRQGSGGEIDDAPRLVQLAREGGMGAVETTATLYDLGQVAGIRAARLALEAEGGA